MIGALAGGDGLEIVVALKDLTAKGFEKIRGEVGKTEAAANRANLSGFSKSAKGVETAAEDAAGAGGRGGISGLAGGLVGLAGGPVGIAVMGIGAVGAALTATLPTYEAVEKREKSLEIALADHGQSLDALRPKIDEATKAGEQYGFNAADTEGAITSLTEANLSYADVEKALPSIMDLAVAKHLSLTDAADAYSKAVYGNAKILKQFGVILPAVSASAADMTKAQDKLTKSQEALGHAQDNLALLTQSLTAKQHLSVSDQIALRKAHDAVTAAIAQHGAGSAQAAKAEQALSDKEALLTAKMKLSAADAVKLKDAQQKVADATKNVTAAQDGLSLAQQGGIDKGARLALLNSDLTKAIGDQRTAVTPMQAAQAKLSDAWERFATTVGPLVEKAFTVIVTAGGWVLDKVSDLIGFLGQLWGWFTKLPAPIQFLVNPIAGLVAHFGDVLNIIGKVIDFIGNLIGKLGDAGRAIANSPIGKIAGGVGGAVGNVAGAVGGAVSNVAGFIGGLIPHFASGGMVDRPTLAMIGEGGEREFVVPESHIGSGAGAPIIIHSHLYLDGREIAYSTERHLGSLFALRGTSARLGSGA